MNNDELGRKIMATGRELLAMVGIRTVIYCPICKKAPCECVNPKR